MSDIDYDHISNLFAIVKGNAEHSGKFAAIQNAAMTELNEINDQLRQNQLRKKEDYERKLAEHQHRQAKLKADEDQKTEDQRKAEEEQSQRDRPRSIPAQNFENSAADHEAQANATKAEREREAGQEQLDLSGKPMVDEPDEAGESIGGTRTTAVDRRI